MWEGALRPLLHTLSWGTGTRLCGLASPGKSRLRGSSVVPCLGRSRRNRMSTYRASAWSFLQTFPAGSPRRWLRCVTLTESICLRSFSEKKQHVAEAYLERDFHAAERRGPRPGGVFPHLDTAQHAAWRWLVCGPRTLGGLRLCCQC